MRKTTLLLTAILLTAAALRFYQIDTNPKAMYGDGLTAVYDAYSVFKTGRDQKGNFLPLVFSLGGGRPGGYVYASVPFAAAFGPTATASVMVSVLSGAGIVFLLFILGRRLFSETAGLFIAAVAAINPWELSMSRGPFESHFALFLTLLGFNLFLKGLKENWWFLPSALSFFLASQTYSTYRLTVPLLVGLQLLWLIRTQKHALRGYFRKPFFLIFLILITASTLLSVYLTVSRGKEDRFDIINIFKDTSLRSSISQKVRDERLLDSLNPTISYQLHRPQIELAGVLAENYIKNFLPDFLFLHGDGQVRHNPAEMGGFYFVDAVFLILGIIYLYQTHKKLIPLLLGWILISAVPTSLVGGAHALRSSLLLPPLLMLTGLGLWNFWNLRKSRKKAFIIIILATVFLIQFTVFLDRFYFVAPQKHERFWSYPAKRASILAIKNRQKFDAVILSNDIDNMEFAYPAYAKLDPNLVIKQNSSLATIGEYKFFKYDNVYIGSLPNTRVKEFIKNFEGSILYIGAAKEQRFLENYRIINGFDTQPDLIVVPKPDIPGIDPGN